MTSSTDLSCPYSNPYFWKAYSRFWIGSSAFDSLQTVARQFADKINSKGDQLSVLCLGVGIGAIEFPLLKALEEVSGKSLNIVGIDQSEMALRAAARLWSGFHLGIAYEDYDKLLFDEGLKPVRTDACFIKCDFDSDFFTATRELKYDLQWTKASPLQEVCKNGGFDLVLASTCLHHLTCWAPTAVNALQLLKPNGMFLVTQVDGDIRYIDSGDYFNSNSDSILAQTLKLFWKGVRERTQNEVWPASGAIEGGSVFQLLDNLPGIKRLDTSFNYESSGSITHSQVETLFRVRGFSPLRRIVQRIGNAEYMECFSRALNQTRSNTNEQIKNRVAWHLWRLDGKDELISSPINNKFLHLERPKTDQEKLDANVSNFERSLAFSISAESFNSKELASTHFRHCLNRLIHSGTLSQYCTGGLMTQSVTQVENVVDSILFANPFRRDIKSTEFAETICRYVLIFRSLAYSQTRNLIAQIVPSVNRPVVLVLRRCAPTNQFQIRCKNRPLFLQLQVDIPDLSSKQKETLKRSESITPIDKLVMDNLYTSGYFQWPAIKSIIDSPDLLKLFKSIDIDTKQIAIELRRQVQSLNLPSGTDSAFSDTFVQSCLMILLTPNWTDMVFYPTCFRNPNSLRVEADEAFLSFYDHREVSNDSESDLVNFQSEYEKFYIVFDQLGIRRATELAVSSGVQQTFSAFSHELSKVTTMLEGRMFQPIDRVFEIEEYSQPNDRWSVSAGRITGVNCQVKSKLASWHVNPIPDATRWLADYLSLWAGNGRDTSESHACLNVANLLSESHSIAEGAKLIIEAKSADWSFGNVVKFDSLVSNWKKEMGKLDLSRICAVEITALRTLLAGLKRALAAIFFNAMQHGTEIKAEASLNSGRLTIKVTNRRSSVEEKNERGTRAVIATSLREFPLGSLNIDFAPMSNKEFWETSIQVLASVQSGYEVIFSAREFQI